MTIKTKSNKTRNIFDFGKAYYRVVFNPSEDVEYELEVANDCLAIFHDLGPAAKAELMTELARLQLVINSYQAELYGNKAVQA